MLPVAVDWRTLDLTKCASCQTELQEMTWKENEYITEDCCGCRICRDCEHRTYEMADENVQQVKDELRASLRGESAVPNVLSIH